MNGLNLGSAFFNFGINSGQFVQGMTEAASGITGFVNKMTGQMSGVSKAFKATDDFVFNSTKTVERYTRMFRDVSPELRKANEWLYTYRASISRLDSQLASSKSRLKGMELAQQGYTDAIKKSKEAYDLAISEEDKLRKSGTATQDQTNAAREAVEKASASLQKATQAEVQHGQTIELQKQRIEGTIESRHRLNNAYDLQKERINSLKSAEQSEKNEQIAAEKAALQAMTGSQKLSSALSLLGIHINGDITLFSRFSTVVGGVGSLVANVGGKIGNIASVTIGTVLAGAVQGVGSSFSGMVQTGLQAYSSFERLGSSMQSLIAREMQHQNSALNMNQALALSVDKSKELLKWTQDLAIASPFSQDGVAQTFKMQMAYGFTADEAQRLTQTMIDFSSGSGQSEESMSRISLALGQIKAKGHVAGGELLQLTEAGLPVLEILAGAFHKTTGEVSAMVEKGIVPADDAIKAIADSLDKDFGGAAKRQAGTMEGLLNSLQDLTTVGLREFFTGTFQAIQPYINKFVDTMSDPAVQQSIVEIGNAIGTTLGSAFEFISGTAIPALVQGFNILIPTIQDSIAFISEISQQAYDWGVGLMNSYGQGIIDAASSVIAAIMDIASTISEWMEPHSPPKFLPQIAIWGQKTAEVYLKGWGDADFSLLNSMSSQVKSMLEDSLGSDNLALIPSLVGTESEIKSAIDEIKTVGSVSEATFKRIHDAAGVVGDDVEKYARAMLASEIANKKLKDAQDQLNAVTKAYDDKLGPLKAKLDALNKKTVSDQSNTQLERLRAMMAVQAPAGMGPDKAKVQAEIDKILLEQQIANTEEEKTAAVDAAQAKVDAAKEVSDAAAAQLKLQQDMMAVQKEQNDLIKQQIALQEKKDAAADKSAATQDKTAEKQAKAAETAAKKLAAEQGAQEQREYKVRLAQAQTADEKLQVMQTEQEKYQAGSKEYLAIQAQIETQKKAVEKATDNAATKEEVAAKKVSDAEFEATLATKDRAGKIDMLREKLGTLTSGSLEYEKTLKRLNALDQAQGAADARKAAGTKAKGAPKGGISGSLYGKDSPLGKPLQDLKDAGEKIVTIGTRVNGFFADIQARMEVAKTKVVEFKDKIVGLGTSLVDMKGITASIVSVLGLLAAHWVWGQVLVWGVKIAQLARIIASLFSPFMLIIGVVALLGYAWGVNFGGIQGVVASVWAKIGPIFDKIYNAITSVIGAFSDGGLSAGFSTLKEKLPEIVNLIGQIAIEIGNGLADWFSSDDIQSVITSFSGIISGMWTWITVTGIPYLISAFNTFAPKIIPWITATASWLAAKIGEWARSFISWVGPMIPPFLKQLGEWGMALFNWIGSQIAPLGAKIGELLGQLGTFLKEHGPKMAEDGVNALLDFVINIGNWLLSTGIPWLIDKVLTIGQSLVPVIASAVGGILTMLPLLLSELTRLIGIVITRLGGWLLSTALPRLFQLLLDAGLGLINLILSLIRNLAMQFPMVIGAIGVMIGRIVVQIIGVALSLITTLVANIPNYFVQLVVAILKFGNTLLSAFGTLIVAIGAFIVGIFSFIGGVIAGGIYQLVQYGRMIVEGFQKGISDAWAGFLQFFVDIWGSLVNWVKTFFGIASPSTVFLSIGIFLIQGLINGIVSLAGAIYDTVKKMLDTILGFFGTNFDDVVSKLVSFVSNFMKNANDLKTKFILAIATLIVDVINKVVAFFADLLEKFGINRDSVMKVVNDFKAKIVAAYDYVLSEGKRIFTGLQTFISDVWNGIKATAAKMFSIEGDSIPGKILQGVFAAVTLIESYLTGDNGSGGLVGTFKNAWDGIGKNIRDFATSIGTDIGLVIDAAKKAATDGLNDMIRLANKAIDAINKVSDAVGLGHIGHIPEVGYALGTSSARGGMALVGENGPEIVNIPSGSSVATNSKTADMFKSQADNISRQVNASIDRAIQAFSSAVGRANKISEDRMLQAIQRASVGGVKATTTNVTTIKNTHEQHDHYNMTVNSRAEVSTVVQDYHTMKLLRRR